MSDAAWPTGADHPPLSLLLLHIEGELENDNARRVASHVTHCWECRTQCEHLRQGIFQFVEFQASETLPSPRSGRGEFHLRLAQSARSETPASAIRPGILPLFTARLTSAFSSRRIIAGSAVALTALTVLLLTTSPRNIAAGQVLDNAIRASKTLNQPVPGRVIFQRVRVRHGNVSFERALYRGVGVNSTTDSIDPEARRVMILAKVDWADPLNPGDFSAWRAAQRNKSDEVRQSAQTVTLDTTSLDDDAVREASLTVEKSDWRPIGRHVQLRDGEPLDITEVSFEIRSVPMTPPTEARLPAKTPERETTPVAPASATLMGPSRELLEESELRVREVFHSIGADLQDAAAIRNDDRRVLFRIFPESPDRGAQILHAVEGIPFVEQDPAGQDSTASMARSDQVQQLTTAFTTIPPLADALSSELGGLDNANTFIASIRGNYARTLNEANALQRLGQRYPPDIVRGLSSATSGRIGVIARDYVSEINRQVSSYLKTVTPVQNDMMRSANLTPKSETPSGGVACVPWQHAADSVIGNVRLLQQSFLRLFVQEQVERPTQLLAEPLLRDAERANAALRYEMQSICEVR